MEVTYDTAKVRDIMIQASEIMLGMGKCIEEKYSQPLLHKAMRIFDAMKRDNPSGCNEYLGALAIGEAHAEGHPWNRDNAEHFVRQKNYKLFMNDQQRRALLDWRRGQDDGEDKCENWRPLGTEDDSVAVG